MRRAVAAYPDNLLQRLTVERSFAGEQLVQYESEGIDIAARGDLFAGQLFRRGSSAAYVFDFVGQSGQPKIHDQNFPAAVEHDVGRLQIAVQHALVVRCRQTSADLACDLDRFVRGQAADAAQQRRQVFAVYVLHRKKNLIVGLADVVDATHVGMRDAPRDAHLIAKAFEGPLVGCGLGQELERDLLAQAQIVGAIDFAHAAATEKRDHAIPPCDQHAGDEAPFVARGMRRRPGRWNSAARRICRSVRRGGHHGGTFRARWIRSLLAQRLSAIGAKRRCLRALRTA